MPMVRALKIRFYITIRSYSLSFPSKYFRKCRISSVHPSGRSCATPPIRNQFGCILAPQIASTISRRSEEHTSELQSRGHLVCRLLLEKKKHFAQLAILRLHLTQDDVYC